VDPTGRLNPPRPRRTHAAPTPHPRRAHAAPTPRPPAKGGGTLHLAPQGHATRRRANTRRPHNQRDARRHTQTPAAAPTAAPRRGSRAATHGSCNRVRRAGAPQRRRPAPAPGALPASGARLPPCPARRPTGARAQTTLSLPVHRHATFHWLTHTERPTATYSHCPPPPPLFCSVPLSSIQLSSSVLFSSVAIPTGARGPCGPTIPSRGGRSRRPWRGYSTHEARATGTPSPGAAITRCRRASGVPCVHARRPPCAHARRPPCAHARRPPCAQALRACTQRPPGTHAPSARPARTHPAPARRARTQRPPGAHAPSARPARTHPAPARRARTQRPPGAHAPSARPARTHPAPARRARTQRPARGVKLTLRPAPRWGACPLEA